MLQVVNALNIAFNYFDTVEKVAKQTRTKFDSKVIDYKVLSVFWQLE